MDIRELIPLHAFGLLDPAEAREVEKAAAADPALAAELAEAVDTAHALAAVPPPEAFPVGSAGPLTHKPSSDVRARLLASIGVGRFESFAPRVAQLFDVDLDHSRELLGLIEMGSAWEAWAPGIGHVHVTGGPACATADCAFIRIASGGTFPWHTHRGEEVTIVLSGHMTDSDGHSWAPGDRIVQALGSKHELRAAGNEDVIVAARADGGIDVLART